MHPSPDMAEAHAGTLQRLRERGERMAEQAYHRACAAASDRDDEIHERWMLLFDKMARGLRLTIALEVRLARQQCSDVDGIEREAQGEQCAPRWRAPAAREAESRECDRERDMDRWGDARPDDRPLDERVADLDAIVEAAEAAPPPLKYKWRDVEVPAEEAAPNTPRRIPRPAERADASPWRGSG